MRRMIGTLALGCLAPLASAQEVDFENHCEIEFNYHVASAPDSLRVGEPQQPLFALDQAGGLRLGEEAVALDETQRELARQYRQEIHASSRDLVEIAIEAVEIAVLGVELAFGILSGEEGAGEELGDALLQVRQRLIDRYQRGDESYEFGPGGLEGLDRIIDEEIEGEMEEIALRSVGSMSWSLLKAVFTGGRNIERRAEAIGAEMEATLEARGEAIERRADALCQRLEGLDALELRVHESIPQLAAYDLVSVRR